MMGCLFLAWAGVNLFRMQFCIAGDSQGHYYFVCLCFWVDTISQEALDILMCLLLRLIMTMEENVVTLPSLL